jgi:hypothetical protein
MRLHPRYCGSHPPVRRRTWFDPLGVILALGLMAGLVFGPQLSACSTSSADSVGEIAQPDFGSTGEVLAVEHIAMSDDAAAFQPSASMPLYLISPAESVTRESMDKMATLLGLGVDREYAAEGLNDSRLAVHFPRSDDITCFCLRDLITPDEAAIQFEQGVEIRMPSLDEAHKTADQALASLGLLDELVFYDASVCDTLTMSGLGQEDRSSAVSIGVWYEATVGGLPLVGPGGRVDVLIGPEGKVIEIRHYAQRAVESAEHVQLRSVAAAVDDLKEGLGMPPSEATAENTKEVVVEKVQLGYYAAPVPAAIADYKPVYLLAVRLADGSVGEWVVSAYAEGTPPLLGQ